MILPILGVLALVYWMAAPDPVTAGARTAAGTGARAAGSGARRHWAAGRDGRNLTRTKRRDRWSKGGGFWRNLLRLEHGAVITAKGVKGAAGITRAAVRPVPAAVKAGWGRGRERHRNRAGNRPAGLALDPPWWRREQPQVQPGEQAPEQVEEQDGDSRDGGAGTGADRAPTTARGHAFPPYFEPGDTLLGHDGSPWTIRQVRPQIDADSYQLVDVDGRPGWVDIPRPDRWKAISEQEDETDPAADVWGDPEPTGETVCEATTRPASGRRLCEMCGERPWTTRYQDPWGGQIGSGSIDAALGRPLRICDQCASEIDADEPDYQPGDGDRQPVKTGPDPADTTTGESTGISPETCPQCGSETRSKATARVWGCPNTWHNTSDLPTPTEGAPMSVNMPSEINDLTTLHSFAQAVIDDAEENGPGSQYAAAAASLSEYFGRDFGREVNATASAFEEAAAALNQAWTAMVEAADAMKNESLNAIGG